jgi:hypothetical protein
VLETMQAHEVQTTNENVLCKQRKCTIHNGSTTQHEDVSQMDIFSIPFSYAPLSSSFAYKYHGAARRKLKSLHKELIIQIVDAKIQQVKNSSKQVTKSSHLDICDTQIV